MAKTSAMRGLKNFISQIRACQNKENEEKLIEKELAKIRGKFGDDKALTSYDKKKYVWKLLYIYMLGYGVEFGHKQACDLIPAQKYSEKQVGYMACSLLLNENDDFLRLAINGIHLDLCSRNEPFHCLALSFVGNVGGQEMAEALTQDVLKLVASGTSRAAVKKKAALCLLRLIRKTPADSQLIAPDTFLPVMINLLEERDMGVLLASVTLMLGICARTSIAGYESCQSRVIKILERCVRSQDVTVDYTYYRIASPWLQCKCLRLLQFFPPPENAQLRKTLHDCLSTVMAGSHFSKPSVTGPDGARPKAVNANESNARHAILLEAISLCLQLDTDRDLLTNAVAILGRFLTGKEPNTKYLALEYISRLALVPEILEAIRHHQNTIIASLKDPDVSIRKRALDLLFTMCDQSNSTEIVQELLKYLVVADFIMREELVLKIAILAEKFAPSVQWYVDVALELLERAGDFVSDDVWHRVAQLVTNNESMQEYASSTVVDVLRRGAAHESLICVAAYVLGEYGRFITARVPALEQFRLLNDKLSICSTSTKGLILTSFMKVFLLDPNNPTLRKEAIEVFGKFAKFMDADLQQRAVEYLALVQRPQSTALQYFQPMPKWEERESSLLRRLAAQEGHDADDAEAGPPALHTESSSKVNGMDLASATSGALQSPRAAPAEARAAPAAAPAQPAAAAAAPAPAPAPAPAAVVDLLGGDLLGDDPAPAPAPAPALAPVASPLVTTAAVTPAFPSSQPPAPAAAAPFASAPANPLDDLADLLAGPGTAPAPQAYDPFAASSTIPQAPQAQEFKVLGDVGAWYNSLLTRDRGVLYEDTFIQIGVQASYQKSRGSLMLYIGNKLDNQACERLVLQVPPTPAMQVAMTTSPPPSLAPKQQIQVGLQVALLGPLLDPPHLLLGYTVGGQTVQQDLRLPIANHKFMVPHTEMQKDAFFEHWRIYSNAPQKQQERLERPTPVSSDSVVDMLRSLNFHVFPRGQLDPSPHNEAGSGIITVGPQEQMGIVEVRLEANPVNRGQFRVTVACADQTVSTTLKDIILHQLKSIPA